ncbi:MAG: hypothetical protein JSS64_02190 [Bacteroidetes bacterium]|nr:hypothetical protein [Bacteroidota bacterium]
MPTDQYIYQDRAVVFLDVLGFQEKLKEFQEEAIKYKEDNNAEFFISDAVNEFIKTFKNAVSFLDENNYNYYLFSDNICITIDYYQNHNLLVDILVTINDLFFKFAEKGYFLRGGLDIGKFVDEKAIAVGIPLANAYKLEQNVATYPRIVLSDNYKRILDDFEKAKTLSEKSITSKKYLIKSHCEVNYINIFFNLIDNDNKIEILNSLKNSIDDNLNQNSKAERIAIKYEWLATQFNMFIDEYSTELMYLETDAQATDEELEIIKALKF